MPDADDWLAALDAFCCKWLPEHRRADFVRDVHELLQAHAEQRVDDATLTRRWHELVVEARRLIH